MRKLLLPLVLLASMLYNCESDTCTSPYVVKEISKSLTGKNVMDLSGLTGDLELNPADATNFTITTTGDVNLNGFTLTLKNVQLNIMGNLNGGGALVTQGAKGAYCLVNDGAVQNNPNLDQAVNSCQSLSNGTASGVQTKYLDCSYSRGEIVTIDGIQYEIVAVL